MLVPGGTSTVGSQNTDPDGEQYSEQRVAGERLETVTVAPFFLARHELTQGQWVRLSPEDNSTGFFAGEWLPREMLDPTHPAAGVNWFDFTATI